MSESTLDRDTIGRLRIAANDSSGGPLALEDEARGSDPRDEGDDSRVHDFSLTVSWGMWEKAAYVNCRVMVQKCAGSARPPSGLRCLRPSPSQQGRDLVAAASAALGCLKPPPHDGH